MDHNKAVRNALFVAMVLVVMMTQRATTHVEAVTHPEDVEALKEVFARVEGSFSRSCFQ